VVVLRPILAVIGAVLLIAAVGLGSFALAMFAIDRVWPTGGSNVERPGRTTLATFFDNNPRVILVCWEPIEDERASYDILIRQWNLGEVRDELRQKLETVGCDASVGVTHIFPADNLYHVMVRSCIGNNCSDWVSVTERSRYWLQIPCRDPQGNGCFFRASESSVRTQ
jgi:hypothetical protein